MLYFTPKRPFEAVYEDQFDYIYNLIYMRVLHRETAEDLTSETFIRAMNAYSRFDPARAGERTWLCRIAQNLLIDHYRKKAANKADLVGDEMLNAIPSEDAELAKLSDPTNQAVYQLLSLLDEDERELLVVRYFEDKKNPEIAEILGINAKAVSERYRRLLLKCEKLLRERGLAEEM